MDTVTDLTARQREVLAALERLTRDQGYPPTLREIGDEVGLASSSSVWAHVRVLEQAQLIERRARRPRAVAVVAATRPGRSPRSSTATSGARPPAR